MGESKTGRYGSAEIKEWVHAKMPELEEMLKDICSIRSVAELENPFCAPFGEGCREVLHRMLQIGEENGFQVRNYDDYVGAITYPGKTEQNIGIWAHLDVVDEGTDWDYSPYEPTIENGYMIARGCNDNKSSAAMAMYVLKFMKEHDITLNHTLELYCGTCEEQGMYDLDYFTEHYKCPTLSLVPDSGFPVCCGERGSFNGELIFKEKCQELLDVQCDCGLYTVPDKAKAVMKYNEERWESCVKGLEKSGIRVCREGEEIHIFADGVSTQAANPGSGDSALTKLAAFICERNLLPESEHKLFEMVCAVNNKDHDGSALQVFCEDEMSGPMKLVATKLNMVEGIPTISFISKYPFSKNEVPFEERAAQAAAQRGFELKVTRLGKATFFNPDRPVVKRLTDCCNEVLGTRDKPFVMSGGTYARKLPNALAFGTGMRVPKAPEGMFRPGHGSYHQPDESISLLRIEKALEVYIRAILEIDDMDLTV